MTQITMDLTAPRARRTDPATSHDAAEKAARFAHGHHLRIRNFLDGIAPRAATYIDIAAGTDLDRHAVGRRLKELFEAGMIEKAGIGALPNGNKATLWRAI